MANRDARGDVDAMDDFFDDERELMAAFEGAAGRPVGEAAEGGSITSGTDEERAANPRAVIDDAVGGRVEQRVDAPAQDPVRGGVPSGHQAPPFWMVLAITAVALALGVVIGYLIGSAVTLSELGSSGTRAGAQQAVGGSVQMPEGHPDVTVDGEGNASVAADVPTSDGASAPAPEDPAALIDDPLARANSYFDMGMAALNAAQDEQARAKAVDLLNQAIVFYDEHLATQDDPSAVVDRAICVFYAGDHEGAIEELEQFVQKDASFAPAWANLGMFYESHDEKGKAADAYKKALEAAEREDAYRVGDYARERLDALSAK